MSVEAFFIVPVTVMEKMEQQLQQQKNQAPDQKSTVEAPLESDLESLEGDDGQRDDDKKENSTTSLPAMKDKEDDNDEHMTLSVKVKKLAKDKKLMNVHFKKFFEVLEKYQNHSFKSPNVDKLIKQALGKSQKHIQGEDEFYHFLLDHNLFHLVRNPHKIARYYKNWFRID